MDTRQRALLRPTMDDRPQLRGPQEPETLTLADPQAAREDRERLRAERLDRAERRAIELEGRRPRFPPVEDPAVTTWGFGVKLHDPDAWVGPQGEQDVAWAWQKRNHAEELAVAWTAMGRRAEVLMGTRARGCLPPAREPWDEGFDPRRDIHQCGSSLRWEPVENRAAAKAMKAAERAAAKALVQARQADLLALRSRRQIERESAEKDRVKALRLILAGDARAPKFFSTLSVLEKEAGEVLWDRDGTHPEARVQLEDYICQQAADEARRDLPLARRITKLLGAFRCATAEDVIATVVAERGRKTRAKAERAAASARADKKRRKIGKKITKKSA